MTGSPLAEGIKQLQARALAGGGFGSQPGEEFRPDATAWAIIALVAQGVSPELADAARQRLAAAQLPDGRVSIAPEHPDALWPTPLAVLAWQGAAACREAQDRAVAFLLAISGLTIKREPESVVGHNTELKGWSWLDGTASWAEPTAMTMMALMVAGKGADPRVAEAQRLLLDRQIPGGGWNYGNTKVFGQVLHPMPESTGIVLSALGGRVPRGEVQQSIAYLEKSLPGLKTPWSLGWALLGLSAWGARPAAAAEMIAACLARQARFNGYDTSSLALLLTAANAAGGLMSLWRKA